MAHRSSTSAGSSVASHMTGVQQAFGLHFMVVPENLKRVSHPPSAVALRLGEVGLSDGYGKLPTTAQEGGSRPPIPSKTPASDVCFMCVTQGAHIIFAWRCSLAERIVQSEDVAPPRFPGEGAPPFLAILQRAHCGHSPVWQASAVLLYSTCVPRHKTRVYCSILQLETPQLRESTPDILIGPTTIFFDPGSRYPPARSRQITTDPHLTNTLSKFFGLHELDGRPRSYLQR